MFGRLIALLLSSRDTAHRQHWNTNSFSQHKTLNEFYDSILELTDSLMEKYQGRHGRVEVPELEEKDTYSKDPSSILKKHLDWIEKARYAAVPKEDTALQNIIDEIVGQYLETLYLLTLK
jgi:DNA-binding ferritin-like protein